MNHLVILAHPNPNSFCAGIRDAVLDAAGQSGHQVKLRDLYALNWNPVLSGQDIVSMRAHQTPVDITEEQSYLAWADLITFIYPVWWSGMPAILKGYIDRCFSNGFAFRAGPDGIEKLLAGKRAVVFHTMGSSAESYRKSGLDDALDSAMTAGMMKFVGIEVVQDIRFVNVPKSTDDERAAMIEHAKETIRGL
ncbi:MAG: NAD(P)H-dependent oxidoreductase [Fimbriimonadaceae bacterium]|nr:NAD(P)H-dependent oxidoreductase [Fimbriimonadaceae bacterium]